MFEPILETSRNAAIILLAVEAIALSAVSLVLLFALLKFWRRTRPKVKNGVHSAAEAVLKVSLATRRVAQQVMDTTAAVRGAPQGVRRALRSFLAGRKEVPHA